MFGVKVKVAALPAGPPRLTTCNVPFSCRPGVHEGGAAVSPQVRRPPPPTAHVFPDELIAALKAGSPEG